MAKKYWLFKTEPSCYSIDHLAQKKTKTDHWDGVRNYQARNFFRDEIKKGDGVLFYHSNAKEIGIAGICEVTRSGYPDFTTWDSDNVHFDPKSTPEKPIWFMVDVKLKKKFNKIITLAQLKETAGLEKMMVIQPGSRLSIQPVTEKEWKIINKLAGL